MEAPPGMPRGAVSLTGNWRQRCKRAVGGRRLYAQGDDARAGACGPEAARRGRAAASVKYRGCGAARV